MDVDFINKKTVFDAEEIITPPPVDAKINVLISSNRLEAYLNIDPPQNGGNPPTEEMINKALSEYKISYGIDAEKIKGLLNNPVYNTNILIAKGLPAVNGTDGSYTLNFQTEKIIKPKELSNGNVDFFELGLIENVTEGQKLCTIVLPTPGSEGITVTGDKIHQKSGKAVPYLVGKNTILSEDGTAILSAIRGHVSFVNGKIKVDDTFVLNDDVSTATGNIKVFGNVVINGNVMPGFNVEADGYIEVTGTVESATLKAGNKMALKSGVTGSDLNCGGDIASRFFENCNVLSRGNIKAEYIVNSNIRCGKNLDITGLYAKLIGGSCVVGGDLTAKIIGTPSCAKTDIELGTDPTNVERQQILVKEIPELNKQLSKLEPLISLLREYEAAGRLNDEKKIALENAISSYEAMKAQLESDEQELVQIDEAMKIIGFGRIICKGTIFPGTRIKISEAVLSVTDNIVNMMLYYSEGEIKLTPTI